MNGPAPAVVVSASRLRAALEETAAALAGADLERLLASDACLQNVLHEIQSGSEACQRRVGGVSEASPTPDLRTEVEAAQTALTRCRRLGAALNDFVRLSLDAQGRRDGHGYEPARAAVAALTGRTFNGRA